MQESLSKAELILGERYNTLPHSSERSSQCYLIFFMYWVLFSIWNPQVLSAARLLAADSFSPSVFYSFPPPLPRPISSALSRF